MNAGRHKSQKRRERRFTTHETLVRHPIVLLFGRPEVKDVTSSREEDDVRFSDLQFLLSQELPSSSPGDCPQVADCEDCYKSKKCLSTRLKDWDRKFSARQLKDMRVYTQKSHLADDLRRLDHEGYVDKTGWGRYRLVEDEQYRNTAMAVKKYLQRTIGDWPVDLILSHKSGYYFLLPGELREEFEEDLNELGRLSDQVRNRIGELRMKSILLDVAAAFERELSRMERDKDRVHLERYLKNHIEIQLVNLGLDEEDFKDQVDGIFSVRLDIDKSELKRIEKEIEEEERAIREARRDISRAFWLEQERSSWAEKYDSLMERSDTKPSGKEIRRTKEALEKEEVFQTWFGNTLMYIPLNVLEDSSIVVTEHSTIASVTPKPHEGQKEIDNADAERKRKKV